MAEIDSRLLLKDQLAYIRRVVNEDEAYLARHNYRDPDSLREQVERAHSSGDLRAAQVPSWKDDPNAIVAILRRSGTTTTRSTPETALERQTRDGHARTRAAKFQPPPFVEVEEMLPTLPTASQRLKYLRGLRERMDSFELAARGASPDAGIYTDDYLALVALVNRETARQRAASKVEASAEAAPAPETPVSKTPPHPTAPFLITGNAAPDHAEALRAAVRRDPSLRHGSLNALVTAARLSGDDPVRTVDRAIERATGWKRPAKDVQWLVAALFAAVGQAPPE